MLNPKIDSIEQQISPLLLLSIYRTLPFLVRSRQSRPPKNSTFKEEILRFEILVSDTVTLAETESGNKLLKVPSRKRLRKPSLSETFLVFVA